MKLGRLLILPCLTSSGHPRASSRQTARRRSAALEVTPVCNSLKTLDGELLQRASELERQLRRVLLDHRRAGVLPHVEGLVERKPGANGALDTALGDLLPVDQQRTGPALADAPPVVLEVEAEGVFARAE